MDDKKRHISFWLVTLFLFVSLLLLLLGQTTAIFNYDFAVRLGFQEPVEEIGKFGVQVNRAFGVSDTLVYIPLIILSLIGLFLKKKWALFTTSSVMGISVYWATTAAFIFYFLTGVTDYHFIPGTEYWVFMSFYIIAGVWGLLYIILKGEKILE